MEIAVESFIKPIKGCIEKNKEDQDRRAVKTVKDDNGRMMIEREKEAVKRRIIFFE